MRGLALVQRQVVLGYLGVHDLVRGECPLKVLLYVEGSDCLGHTQAESPHVSCLVVVLVIQHHLWSPVEPSSSVDTDRAGLFVQFLSFVVKVLSYLDLDVLLCLKHVWIAFDFLSQSFPYPP